MEPATLNARRATLDDLPALLELWKRVGLPGEQLEKYLTEFQVVEGEDGGVLGALGLLVEGDEGLIHSEAIAADDQADALRQCLWHRLLIVSRNQGVHRLWTQEDAPYWQSVFQQATPAILNRLNASFRDPDANWWVAPVGDPDKAAHIVQEQMAIWEASREKEKDELDRTVQTARTVALVISAVVIGMCVLIVVYAFSRNPGLVGRFFGR